MNLARESDVVVWVCGDDKITSGEGMDRCDLKLYGKQRELIHRVAELQKPAVLVLESGKPVDLSDEVNLVDGIMEAWFGGELGATAIAEVLLGKKNSFGRLPVSFPKGVGYLPCYYSRLPGGSKEYLEGSTNALFPFGFGLSYTEFAYRDLRVRRLEGPCDFEVTVKVKNTGDREGSDVVQLYVNDLQSSVVRPDKLLKGFRRVELQAGEFDMMIGRNSADIVLTDRITIDEDVKE